MSKIAATIQRIKEEHIGQTGKRLLLVEGSDDVTAFSIFLEKKRGNQQWEQQWLLHPVPETVGDN